ncbi:alpha/beta hydrolase [Rossellomorea aquimaris]|uniref:alpha/beta fold hydrolase n=1 Tax=Rossellomorea aquimaris TaxID=189382 RepID=UPI001CD30548|nr:alpha/beta hydrolase [Rossellomorea aquimaris]MCA1058798.1 alpha/beta hydrolase [Rossellomorea aquimaris]
MILHTTIKGDGPPVVFLHTGLQTGLTDFQHQSDYFQKKYSVILPDLRGHGQSLSEDFSNFFEDCAADLFETLSQLRFKQVHIIGCSLGALVGVIFANRYPDHILSLTISGILTEKPENWSDSHQEEVKNQAILLENKEATAYFDDIHSSEWRKFIDLARNEDWYPFNETSKIQQFTFPTLFLVGESNSSETDGAVSVARQNNNVHCAVIPFAGHLVHIEQSEIYRVMLDQFLTQVNDCKEDLLTS